MVKFCAIHAVKALLIGLAIVMFIAGIGWVLGMTDCPSDPDEREAFVVAYYDTASPDFATPEEVQRYC